MKSIFTLILLLIIISIIWILLIKLVKATSFKNAAICFKCQIFEIIQGLSEPIPKSRFLIEPYMETAFQNIAKPYSNIHFDITAKQTLIYNLPCVIVEFVAKNKYSDDELQDIANLEALKLKKYFLSYNLNLDIFAYPIWQDDVRVQIYLFYQEFEEDFYNFNNLKMRLANQDFDSQSETVVDLDLEDELENVD